MRIHKEIEELLYEKGERLKEWLTMIGYDKYYADLENGYEEAVRQRKVDMVFAVTQSGDSQAKYMKRQVLSAEMNLASLDAWLREIQRDEKDDEWKGRIIVDFKNNEIIIYNYYVE